MNLLDHSFADPPCDLPDPVQIFTADQVAAAVAAAIEAHSAGGDIQGAARAAIEQQSRSYFD